MIRVVAFALLLAGVAPAQERDSKVENVILFIGDGMGLQQVTLARLAGRDRPEDPLAMETLPEFGAITTHSADNLVTDSAAAATAMATGVKVDNHVLSSKPDGKPIRTILEAAEAKGLASGLVTTTRITHATPAAFASHAEERTKEAEIARQYLDCGAEVLLGGGAKHFDDEALAAFRKKGYEVVTDRAGLGRVRTGSVLGLFHEDHMSYELDRGATQEPSLEDMTTKAIDLLGARGKGFFLMVEGGRIDLACHGHDAAASVADTLAFDRAVAAATRWAREDGHTLVVVTADHTTGGLAITERLDLRALRSVKASAEAMATRIKKDGESLTDVLRASTGFELTAEELGYIDTTKSEDALAIFIAHNVSHHCGVEFYALSEQGRHRSTKGHDGTSVPVYSLGPGSSAFHGFLDNTDVAKRLASALDLDLRK